MNGYTDSKSDAANRLPCDTLEVRRRIGARIRTRRAELGMEQLELASSAGISQTSISKYESASVAMRAEDIPALARALDVTPSYFFDNALRSEADELGVDWQQVETKLLKHFRDMSPSERLLFVRSMLLNDLTTRQQWTGVEPETKNSL